MTLSIILEIEVNSAQADGYARTLPELFMDTRVFEGCLSIEAYRDNASSERFFVVEEWESARHYEQYIEWRRQTGRMNESAIVVRRTTKYELTRLS